MAAVELRGVSKGFGATPVLRDVDLTVEPGEFLVLVGPSGCGKSTLLRAVAGLDDVDSGEVMIDDLPVNGLPPARRGIAMVFQSYALYPQMSVYENMAFGLRLSGKPRSEIDTAVKDAAELLDLDHLLDRRPRALSGGQRQRVAIGRAIVRQPLVFLFDEPLSNLDAALRVRMRYEFAQLHQRLKTTTIYVTHDQVEAMTLADRIAVMDRGKIEQLGRPEDLYERPASQFVAGFIGSPKMNLLDAKVEQAGNSSATIALRGGHRVEAAVDATRAKSGDAVTLGIRPEHVELSTESGIPAKVTLVEWLGNMRFAYVDAEVADEPLIMQMPAGHRLADDERIMLRFDSRHCHLFDAEGQAFDRIAGTPGSVAA